MTLKKKVTLYEEALNSIASWKDGSKPNGSLDHLDEPGAAGQAREVLVKTGAVKK